MNLTPESLAQHLATWEATVRRPGLPCRDFVVVREDGGDAVATHPEGRIVYRATGRIQSLTPAPDSTAGNIPRRVVRPVAVAVARADETATLEIVRPDASGSTPVRGLELRHESSAWSPDGRALFSTASGRKALVRIDANTGRWTRVPLPPDSVEVRVHGGGGGGGALSIRRTAAPSMICDLEGVERGCAPIGFLRLLCSAQAMVVVSTGGLDAHPAAGPIGVPSWTWHAGGTVIDAAVGPDGIVVVTVVDGRTQVTLVGPDGAEKETFAARVRGERCTVTGVSTSSGGVWGLVEGLTTPPTCVPYPFVGAGNVGEHPGPAARTRVVRAAAEDAALIDIVLAVPTGHRGPVPVLLEVYGGFGVPLLPRFEPTTAAWLSCGGAVALAQVRGGGERDRDWCVQGRGTGKIRAVDDLAAAARVLVAEGITTPEMLVLTGGSLGGTVAAACGLRHRRLAAAVVATAAPLDLFRLTENPLGSRWIDEFGDARTDPAEVSRYCPTALAAALTSPVGLPAFLCVSMSDDTRIDNAQADRLVRALRAKGVDAENIRIDRAGHGANLPAALHELGSQVLGFAARRVATARTTPTGDQFQ